eukprot:3499425-Amphidinium_carterae.1
MGMCACHKRVRTQMQCCTHPIGPAAVVAHMRGGLAQCSVEPKPAGCRHFSVTESRPLELFKRHDSSAMTQWWSIPITRASALPVLLNPQTAEPRPY